MISILVSVVRVVLRTNLLSKYMFHIHLDDCVFWSCWVECPVGWYPHFCYLLPSSEEERGGKTSYFCFDIFYWSPYSVNISQSWRLWISGVLVRKEASRVVLRREERKESVWRHSSQHCEYCCFSHVGNPPQGSWYEHIRCHVALPCRSCKSKDISAPCFLY